MTERISNIKLGELLGLSHASVSRIRSGDRLPSLDVMHKISYLTGWTMDEQTARRNDGTYNVEFDRAFEGVTFEDLQARVTVPGPRESLE